MKKKLIIYNIVVTVVVLLLMFGMGILVTNSNYREISERKIKEITAVYSTNYSEGLEFPDDDNVRVTVIDATGKVLKDSSGQISGESHLYREEVEAAAKGNPAVVVRTSDTLGKEMMYYAEKVEAEGVTVYIRVAIPTESINSYALKSIVPMLTILLGAWLIAVVAGVLLSGVLLKPLKQVKDGLAQIDSGAYKKIPPTTDDEDINEILCGINDLSEKLQNNMLSAENEKKKLDYVLSNVFDGIAVFDGDLNVIIANRSLKKIFGVSEPEGKHIEALTADRTFISVVGECARNNQDAIFQLESDGRCFLCSARCTESGITIAVLSDITQTKQNEKMRLEFFANASHELKTPLTAINGFNDMITLQSDNKSVAEYSRRIKKEMDRVINLLNDMLDLSKLENSSLQQQNLVRVDVRAVAEEVAEELKPQCSRKEVSLTVEGEAVVSAEREHIYELVKNLAENGVRYNNKGGSVTIRLSSLGGESVIEVGDDGIGIDAGHQSRIFERFYRVDKSRSRATGGTGLGLAIVKHICSLYNADISLKSKLGAGTTVTVIFKAEQ